MPSVLKRATYWGRQSQPSSLPSNCWGRGLIDFLGFAEYLHGFIEADHEHSFIATQRNASPVAL